ncbi:hypothetical protein [Mycoplasma suis]|uniref:Uncharacterized protein n=1 Tax=Mycoplasma suis (strain Illinois) TaxID=768700 RepID=F0QRJ4_MYCSL|nr:hypothetical protein [Mycoplasma suis]ADX98114.1 hypothetical protein MSU_0582 [Mycoplasma suis str. Illinois]
MKYSSSLLVQDHFSSFLDLVISVIKERSQSFLISIVLVVFSSKRNKQSNLSLLSLLLVHPSLGKTYP